MELLFYDVTVKIYALNVKHLLKGPDAGGRFQTKFFTKNMITFKVKNIINYAIF